MSLTETCGGRIKLARGMLGLSRKKLEDDFQVSVNTLQSWESDRNILSLKGAKKLNEIFIRLGLLCSEDWLINGGGQGPILLQEVPKLPTGINQDICILREMEVFKSINPDPIVVIINDDAMEPIYSSGEFVAGNKKNGFQINSLIGENCIVQTIQGDTFTRRLMKGSRDNYFNLSCININTRLPLIITDLKLKFAAKIVLHRKKEDDYGC